MPNKDDNNIFIKSLAKAEYKVGNIMSSIELYERALKIYPEEKDLYMDFSFIYYETGELEKSIEIIKNGISHITGES